MPHIRNHIHIRLYVLSTTVTRNEIMKKNEIMNLKNVKMWVYVRMKARKERRKE